MTRNDTIAMPLQCRTYASWLRSALIVIPAPRARRRRIFGERSARLYRAGLHSTKQRFPTAAPAQFYAARLEIVDSTGTRYQTCGYYGVLPGQVNNLPCVNRLPGSQYSALSRNYYAFQVPGSGTSPVTFFVRVSDARGDARPDFIYTFLCLA